MYINASANYDNYSKSKQSISMRTKLNHCKLFRKRDLIYIQSIN